MVSPAPIHYAPGFRRERKKIVRLTVDQREHKGGQREAAETERCRVSKAPVVDGESGLALHEVIESVSADGQTTRSSAL